MKDITRISLAALPFNIDEPAQKELETYLHAIERTLHADRDAMREIEARIIELLAERGVNGEKVISVDDIAMIKSQLGDPKDFADEAVDVVEEPTSAAPRRLMRDPTRAIFAGVASGMAAYFKLDVLVVRLLWIAATLVTAGTAIPLYLVMWLLVPKAQTAADRLQMAGESVTLASLKQASVAEAVPSHTAAMVQALFRVLGGIVAACTGAAAFMALVTMGWHVSVDSGAHIPSGYWLPVGLMAGAGVVFVIFCALIAYMLFAKNFARRIWLTLVGLTVMGLVLFGAGVGMTMVGYRYDAERAQKADVVKSLDATQVAGITTITTDSKNMLIHYIVSPGTPKVELHYNTMMTNSVPQVKIERSGATLMVGASAADPVMCIGYCSDLAILDIYGPSLDATTVQTGSFTYETAGQPALAVTASSSTTVRIEGTKPIEAFTATLAGVNFDATTANLNKVTLTADNLSTVSLGNIGALEAAAPITCTKGSQLSLSVSAAVSIAVNGTVTHEKVVNAPCYQLQVGTE